VNQVLTTITWFEQVRSSVSILYLCVWLTILLEILCILRRQLLYFEVCVYGR